MKYYPGFVDLFDDWFDDMPIISRPSNLMRTDITEKDGHYELDIEVPGVNKDDIKIELNNGYLNVSATRNTNDDEKDSKGNVIRQERFTGSYSRSFYVGDHVNEDDIKAKFDNGELKITIPTKEQKQEDTKKLISIE